jgi:hypothetical protein
MRVRLPALVIAFGILAPSSSLMAHHSVAVNFDQSQEVSVEGVLREITWRNPHSHFRIDVMNPDGSSIEWLVEMGAVNTMRRVGFATDLFEIGNPITITGWPGRRDRTVYLLEAILQDGTELICAGASCNPER